ncbi:MAG TPA: glycosyltransferase [Elusimicrobiota bacterium]|jgi:glycosyltransferase involved in cell wall biosynthesis|nr:glycosyltransferase [Elusimicrobiota bacterium]
MKLISVVTPCFNEEDNVRELHARIKDVFAKLPGYAWEHICIDNDSSDRTVEVLRELAREDKSLKVIVNARNFGHIRSPHHALLQAKGDAVIFMMSDLQDPPELIAEFVAKWEAGFKIVLAVKTRSEETPLMFLVRKAYYDFIGRLSEVRLVKNSTGFGLYDRAVMDVVRTVDDPYPYFRGLICDIGFEQAHVEYTQACRRRGITKNNFYTLYDMAMLGITNHSKVPLRLATIFGFAMSALGFLLAFGYLIAKLVFWNKFTLGTAPILIGFFLFSSIQLFFIGILGEYIGAIHTQVLKRPLVVEKERINF